MAGQLLIRVYNVEVGDCIYCRIPNGRKPGSDGDGDFHILIDCGTRGKGTLLEDALDNMKSELLPDAPNGKKRLDLLVVTHEHSDHIKGFDAAQFKDIAIGAIWMSAAMNPKHPQAEKSRSLHSFAATAMRAIADQGQALSPELSELMEVYSVQNDEAMETLHKTLPKTNRIKPTYVHAGMKKSELALPLRGASIKVLGPEEDIDHFYLGDDLDTTLRSLVKTPTRAAKAMTDLPAAAPKNITTADFRRLRSRMASNAFAFADLASAVQNNACVVLLIEWKGKRLLFVGDCEWEHTYRKGKKNGGWNVMWRKRQKALNAPVDFLKIGHHGSTNSTPWNDRHTAKENEPETILDAILPLPKGRKKASAVAVVSTRRSSYKVIPKSELLAEIGRRVGNTRDYGKTLTKAGVDVTTLNHYDEYEKTWLNKKQPWRTDFEGMLSGKPYVDVEIDD